MTMTGRRNSGRGILNRWGLCFMSIVISLLVLTSVSQAGEVTRNLKINNWKA